MAEGSYEEILSHLKSERLSDSPSDLRTVLDLLLQAAVRMTKAERGFLMLLNDQGQMEVMSAHNWDPSLGKIYETELRKLFLSGEAWRHRLMITDAWADPRLREAGAQLPDHWRSLRIEPLKYGDRVIGVVVLTHPDEGHFDVDSELDEGVWARQAAIAIQQVMLSAAAREHASRTLALLMMKEQQQALEESQASVMRWLERAREAAARIAMESEPESAKIALGEDVSLKTYALVGVLLSAFAIALAVLSLVVDLPGMYADSAGGAVVTTAVLSAFLLVAGSLTVRLVRTRAAIGDGDTERPTSA